MSVYDRVYEIVKQIPKGKVATYGQIGTMLGNVHYARMVGNALHVNPNPALIPCHRVVNSAGCLAAQYAFGGATAQAEKLAAEEVPSVNGKVDLKVYQWNGDKHAE